MCCVFVLKVLIFSSPSEVFLNYPIWLLPLNIEHDIILELLHAHTIWNFIAHLPSFHISPEVDSDTFLLWVWTSTSCGFYIIQITAMLHTIYGYLHEHLIWNTFVKNIFHTRIPANIHSELSAE